MLVVYCQIVKRLMFGGISWTLEERRNCFTRSGEILWNLADDRWKKREGSVKSGEISWSFTSLWNGGFHFRTAEGEMSHHGEVSDLPLNAEGYGGGAKH